MIYVIDFVMLMCSIRYINAAANGSGLAYMLCKPRTLSDPYMICMLLDCIITIRHKSDVWPDASRPAALASCIC